MLQGELLSVPLHLTSPSVVHAEAGSNFVVDFVRLVDGQSLPILSLLQLQLGPAPPQQQQHIWAGNRNPRVRGVMSSSLLRLFLFATWCGAGWG